MTKKNSFSVIGGDKRMVYLANILRCENFEVSTYGIESEELSSRVNRKISLKEATQSSDIIISPLPFSYDSKTVNCKLFDKKISIESLFQNLNKHQQLFAGYVKDDVKELAQTYNVKIQDYFEREELMISNCIPTAEGAIKIAIEELPYTLHGSKCLIMGFGRIGKILSKILIGIGADVTVEARKYADLAWIRSYAYKHLPLNDLEENISNFDVIFNTIPYIILDENILKKVNKNCLIIDLASKPGGVDFEAAKRLNLKTNWALGLPGKVAPYTAASYIKEAIFNILSEKGVDIYA